MPTYEYACTACAEHIEVVQRFTDASLTECPSCSGRLRKVFSPVGVVFKGSGFYKNDSRDSAKSGAKKVDSSSTSGSKSDSSKSDSTRSDSTRSDSAGDTKSSGSDSGGTSTAKPDGSTAPKSTPSSSGTPSTSSPPSTSSRAAAG